MPLDVLVAMTEEAWATSCSKTSSISFAVRAFAGTW
jgi:hypothetical protein